MLPDYLTLANCPGTVIGVRLIETVLPQLPRLRSLVVRGNIFNPLPADISLVSESLESFIVHNDKRVEVTSFRCPKLRTFQLSNTYPKDGESVWKALETGAHAMDLETVPADCGSTFYHHSFVDGVFSFNHNSNPRCLN